MNHHQYIVVAASVGSLILATRAPANDVWKTVTLDGKADFTVSIPAAVSDYSSGKNPATT